jgi:hypothetical protein
MWVTHSRERDDLLQLGHVGSLGEEHGTKKKKKSAAYTKENDDDAGECNEHTQVVTLTHTASC